MWRNVILSVKPDKRLGAISVIVGIATDRDPSDTEVGHRRRKEDAKVNSDTGDCQNELSGTNASTRLKAGWGVKVYDLRDATKCVEGSICKAGISIMIVEQVRFGRARKVLT
jgi:hypothetical protein